MILVRDYVQNAIRQDFRTELYLAKYRYFGNQWRFYVKMAQNGKI